MGAPEEEQVEKTYREISITGNGNILGDSNISIVKKKVVEADQLGVIFAPVYECISTQPGLTETERRELERQVSALETELKKGTPDLNRLQELKSRLAKGGGWLKEKIDKVFSNPVVVKVLETAAAAATTAAIKSLTGP